MKQQNNRYIGTIIKGDKEDPKSKEKVIFKVGNKVYIHKIKEKNQNRLVKYQVLESVNIICDDLNGEYVYIDSNNQIYINKIIIFLFAMGMLLGFVGIFIGVFNINVFGGEFPVGSLIMMIFLLFLFLYIFYVVAFQRKKLYSKCTEIVEGEIVNYIRNKYYEDGHPYYDYMMMYKFRTLDGHNIYSLIPWQGGTQLLYSRYPINKKVLIKYNPLNCCQSCLKDECDSGGIYGEGVRVLRNFRGTTGTITNIITNSIEGVDEHLKEHCLFDFLECEYYINNLKYKGISLFSVPHNTYKVGDEITVFYVDGNFNKFL